MKGKLETICINCPMGCPLTIEEINGEVVVKGYTCLRGKKYGEQEYVNPMRVVTSVVLSENGTAQPVKTSGPIPKDKIFDVVKAISNVTASNNTKIGDVIVPNILELGVDVIATRDSI